MKRTPIFAALAMLALSACTTTGNPQGASFSDRLSSMRFQMPSFLSPEKTPSNNETNTQYADAADCPKVAVVDELKTIHQFSDNKKARPENETSSMTIAKLETRCSHHQQTITVALDMTFHGTLGAQGQRLGKTHQGFSYPYFVAVTAPDGDILAKEVYAVSAAYNDGQTTATEHDSLRQIIPLRPKTQARDYEILVGFQLNDDQLAFNRYAVPAASIQPASGNEQ